ncbi:MAG: hypothetical protein JW940_14485 [Polyangiaceae bacterium]|nr:hypothetical protein [Polyangiaceae bacterium]
MDQSWTTAWTSPEGAQRVAAFAEVFLRACAVGAPCDELAVGLANAVLDASDARLALKVLESESHRIAFATELAGRVLDEHTRQAGAPAEPVDPQSGRGSRG